MEKGWKQVFLTTLEHKVAIAENILEKNNIKSVILNKKDSAYLTFGEIAIFVEESKEQMAIELLKEL